VAALPDLCVRQEARHLIVVAAHLRLVALAIVAVALPVVLATHRAVRPQEVLPEVPATHLAAPRHRGVLVGEVLPAVLVEAEDDRT